MNIDGFLIKFIANNFTNRFSIYSEMFLPCNELHNKLGFILPPPLLRLLDGVLWQHTGFNAHLAGEAEVVDGDTAEFFLGLFQFLEANGQFIVPIGEAFLCSAEVMTGDMYAADHV